MPTGVFLALDQSSIGRGLEVKHSPRGKATLRFERDRLVIESNCPLTRRSDSIHLRKDKFSRRLLRRDVDAPVAYDVLPALFEELGDFVDDTTTAFASFKLQVPLIPFLTEDDKQLIGRRFREIFRKHHIRLEVVTGFDSRHAATA